MPGVSVSLCRYRGVAAIVGVSIGCLGDVSGLLISIAGDSTCIYLDVEQSGLAKLTIYRTQMQYVPTEPSLCTRNLNGQP